MRTVNSGCWESLLFFLRISSISSKFPRISSSNFAIISDFFTKLSLRANSHGLLSNLKSLIHLATSVYNFFTFALCPPLIFLILPVREGFTAGGFTPTSTDCKEMTPQLEPIYWIFSLESLGAPLGGYS